MKSLVACTNNIEAMNDINKNKEATQHGISGYGSRYMLPSKMNQFIK